MRRSSGLRNPVWLVLTGLLCAAGTWTYASRVLIPYQIADASAHDRPRGNLSDLYPRWWGARELLLRGRDPYSPEVTREIQEGYYGHPLDSSRPADPKDQQKFAYPVYVVFYLAPMIRQPFAVAREEAFWILLALTILTVPLWLRVLRWPLPSTAQLAIGVLTVGSLPVLQGLKLQQMTLLVAALVAIAIRLLIADRQIPAGIMLALATVKPQLVCFLLLWLLFWTLPGWRRRARWLLSFLVTLAVLFAASEHLLPHWLARFFQAVRDYRSYTDAMSILGKLIPSPWAALLGVLVAVATVYVCWKNRGYEAGTPAFARTVILVLSVTVILIPTYALYNQILLLPALLLLAQGSARFWNGGPTRRGLLLLVGVFLVWPWVTSLVLAGLSFLLPAETVEAAWLPFWTALLLPVGVAALVLMANVMEPFAAHLEPRPS